MNTFIHTISLKKYINTTDKTKLTEVYKNNTLWLATEKNYIMHKYSNLGITLKIAKNSKPEETFDKQHHKYKVEIIINLFKLLHPGMEYGMITKENDIESAINNAIEILNSIHSESGIYLHDNLILKRVDIAKDVITPSDEYTLEIIRLSRLAPKKYGYTNYTPDEKSKKKKWRLEDSSMYYSKNINAKVYNKKQDLVNHNFSLDIDNKGLLRFEVSLKTKPLIENGYINSKQIQLKDLSVPLCKVTRASESIISNYFKQVLMDGSMVSKQLQNKYLKMKFDGKNVRIKNMKTYRDAVNNKNKYDFTTDKAYRALRHFESIKLSPVYTVFPYIPSFSDILDGKTDEEISRFAYIKPKDKNQLFW